MQVGYVGLMKAISRFDPAVGSNLAAYAQVCISGEIKQHLVKGHGELAVPVADQEL
jgi:RNA polymerase sigma-B factor